MCAISSAIRHQIEPCNIRREVAMKLWVGPHLVSHVFNVNIRSIKQVVIQVIARAMSCNVGISGQCRAKVMQSLAACARNIHGRRNKKRLSYGQVKVVGKRKKRIARNITQCFLLL